MRDSHRFAGLVFSLMFAASEVAASDPLLVLVPPSAGVGVGRDLSMRIAAEVTPELDAKILKDTGLHNYRVTWSSSNKSVAKVNRKGIVTGASEGTATITATVTYPSKGPTITLHSEITVGAQVARLSGQSELTLIQYCSGQVNTLPVDSSGRSLDDRLVGWQSQNQQVANVRAILPVGSNWVFLSDRPDSNPASDTIYAEQTVSVRGVGLGRTILTASCERVSTEIPVSVRESVVSSLELVPDSLELDVNETEHVAAVSKNQQGCMTPVPALSWQTDDSSIASVTELGEIRGVKAGVTRVTAATEAGISASVIVKIPAVAAVVVSTTCSDEVDIDEKCSVEAKARASDGRALYHREVVWSSSNNVVTLNPTTGTISPVSGKAFSTVTGRKPGVANVVASSEGISSAPIPIIVPAVAKVAISPPSATLAIGDSREFSALVFSPKSRSLEHRIVEWRQEGGHVTLQPSVGYVTKATGTSKGDGTITAVSEGVVSNKAAIHVKPSCEAARLMVKCIQKCGYFDTQDSCHPTNIIDSRIKVSGWITSKAPCDADLSEKFSDELEQKTLTCQSWDCRTVTAFSIISLRPGKWTVQCLFNGDPREASITLRQDEGQSIEIVR